MVVAADEGLPDLTWDPVIEGWVSTEPIVEEAPPVLAAAVAPVLRRPAAAIEGPGIAAPVRQRPAAAMGKPEVDERKKMEKRVHSNAFHKAESEARRAGLQEDEVKRLRQEAGKAALAKWRAEHPA